MKILWLSHLIPYPPRGGVLQRAHHLVNELAKHHDLDLLAFNQEALLRPIFPTVKDGVEEAARFLQERCRRWHFVRIPVDGRRLGKVGLAVRSLLGAPYNLRWLKSREFAACVRRWTGDTKYDLVHFDTVGLVQYEKNLAAACATALDHHNIESTTLIRRASNDTNSARKLYWLQEGVRLRRIERAYCPRFSMNITCSESDSHALRDIAPGSRVETIPNPVDTDYFRPCVEDSQLRLIFVGRLNWYPNAQAVTFIVEQLWPAVSSIWPSIEFDLVGANAPRNAIALGKKDHRFRVHGYVEDVRPLLARATAYVCPITDGGGTKLKVLDAMAMGKAIVADPIACEGLAVVDGETVLLARSVAQYVEQLRTVFGQGDRRCSLGEGARRLAEERYGKVQIGKRLAKLYEGCVRAPHQP